MVERVDNPFGVRSASAQLAAQPSIDEPSLEAPAGIPAPRRRGHPPDPLPGLRELTGWEEELIERHGTSVNTSRLCNELLARCLVSPGRDPGDARPQVDSLLVAERDQALVALRRKSLGDRVEMHVDCPRCGQTSEVSFDLATLPLGFTRPPERLTLESSDGGTITLRMPTAGDQAELLDADLDGDAERRSWMLARLLLQHGERTEGFDLDYARSLPTRLRRQLEGALDKVVPALDLSMGVACEDCGHQFAAPFDVAGFFLTS